MKKEQIPGVVILVGFTLCVVVFFARSCQIKNGKLDLSPNGEKYFDGVENKKRNEVETALGIPLPKSLSVQRFHRLETFDLIPLIDYSGTSIVYIFLYSKETNFNLTEAVHVLNQKTPIGSWNDLLPKSSGDFQLIDKFGKVNAQKIELKALGSPKKGVLFELPLKDKRATFIIYGDQVDKALVENILTFYQTYAHNITEGLVPKGQVK